MKKINIKISKGVQGPVGIAYDGSNLEYVLNDTIRCIICTGKLRGKLPV